MLESGRGLKKMEIILIFQKKILGSILGIFREVMTKNRSCAQNRPKGRGGGGFLNGPISQKKNCKSSEFFRENKCGRFWAFFEKFWPKPGLVRKIGLKGGRVENPASKKLNYLTYPGK